MMSPGAVWVSLTRNDVPQASVWFMNFATRGVPSPGINTVRKVQKDI